MIDPQLVPLVYLGGSENIYGQSMLCYSIDELAEGRSTVIGLQDIVFRDAVVIPARYGDSLLLLAWSAPTRAAGVAPPIGRSHPASDLTGPAGKE